MLARVFSCAVIGLEGVIIEVEVDYSNGLPAVIIVGLPDAAVQESRERVQTAVKNAGLNFPRHRIVVNLAPAAVRKEGPAYDLPIALGVMILAGFLPHEVTEGTIVVGELSLDGVVRHTRGILPMAATARANGFKRMFVPEVDAGEAALIPDLEIIPVKTLADLYRTSPAAVRSSPTGRTAPSSSRSSSRPISARSRARNTSSAPSRSPQPAATTRFLWDRPGPERLS